MPQQPHHSPHQYSDRLYNADLAPTRQNWNWYNILAFWLSDVHSVGGYVVAASRHYKGTVKAYGLIQEFTTPYTPEQNGLVERFFRSLKEECIWHHRFESLGQARTVIDRWIRYYNEERPHQSLDYVAPRAHPALAA